MGRAESLAFSRRRFGKLCLAAGTVVLLSRQGRADEIYWQVSVGDWTNADNWSDITADTNQVPGSSDEAYVDNGGTAQISNGSESAGYFTADFGSTLMLGGAGSLSVSGGGGEAVGGSAVGVFNQSGGINTITNSNANLILGESGGSTGTYILSGTGSLLSLSSDSEYIGYSGTGIFNQSGGTNSLGNNGVLNIGYNSGSSGDYMLSGAGTLFAGSEYVGNGGSGSFVQSGSANKALNVYVGYDAGSSGNYALGGTGSLCISSAGTEFVGCSGTGVFNQSGGTNSLGNNAVLYVGYNSGSTGTYSLTGTGSLSVSLNEQIGINGAGNFNQGGGTNTAGSAIYLGYDIASTGTYAMSDGTLDTIGADQNGYSEYIGYCGTGNFNQSGGTNTASYIVLGANSGSTGTYTLSSGTLSCAYIGIGQIGSGNLNQTGGSLSASDHFSVGNLTGANGTYTLSGNGILFAYYGDIGFQGTGIFNQTGGTNSINSGLYLGGTFDGAGGMGTYLLSGTGTLAVGGNEYVGYNGTGFFSQSGGTNTISGELDLGNNPSSTGNYTLNGGTLAASAVYVGGSSGGTGALTVSGTGVLNVTGVLEIYNNSGSSIIFNGGTINTGALNLSGNFALFNWSAGTLNLTNPSFNAIIDTAVNGGNLTSSITLRTGQELAVAGSEDVGNFGTGVFNQAGGTNIVAGELGLGYYSGSTGLYTLSGGSLAAANIFVGGSGGGLGGVGNLIVNGPSASLSASGTITIYKTGSASISAGTISAAVLNLAGSTFTQSGGSASFAQIAGTGAIAVTGGKMTLQVGGGSSQVNNLSISGLGMLDIANTLAINYGSPDNDPVKTIAGYLATGYFNGQWTGIGINSSTAAMNPSLLSVGYADGNKDAGTAAGPNQVLVKYTLAGDANLDGLVNFQDLVTVVQNFNKGGTDWAHGNFGYGPSTSFNDLVAVVQNFNKVLPPAGNSDELPAGTIQIESDAVPLPESSILAPAMAAAALFRRKRPGKSKIRPAGL